MTKKISSQKSTKRLICPTEISSMLQLNSTWRGAGRFALAVLMLAAAAVSAGATEETITVPATCKDGLDNDGDNFIDNFDEDCDPLADPGFEAYTSCPNAAGQFGTLLPDWELVSGTAELFVYPGRDPRYGPACDFRPSTIWGGQLVAAQPESAVDGFAIGGIHNKGKWDQETIIQNLRPPLGRGSNYNFTIFATKLVGAGARTEFNEPEDRALKVYGIRTGAPQPPNSAFVVCDLSTLPGIDYLEATEKVTLSRNWQQIHLSFTATESYDRLVFTVECDSDALNNTYLLIDGLTFGLDGAPPNLSVSIDNGVTSYTPGGTAAYTIVVRNIGSGNAEKVSVDNILPPGMTVAASGLSCVASGPTGFASCGNFARTASGITVSEAKIKADRSGRSFLTYTVPVVLSAQVSDYGGTFPATLANTVRVADVLEPATTGVRADNSATDTDRSSNGTPVSQLPPSCPPPNSWGEVHISTPDRLGYDFQDAGEYLFVASSDGTAVIQARLERWPSNRLLSINTAMAVNVNGDHVGVYVKRSPGLYVNGQPGELTTTTSPLLLPNGGKVHLLNAPSGPQYIVEWPNGMLACAKLFATAANAMDIGMSKPTSVSTTTLKGFMGNLNGLATDDYHVRDGDTLTPGNGLGFKDLYCKFGDSWRITATESLFDYEPGSDSSTFNSNRLCSLNQSFTVNDLSAADRAKGQQACAAAGVTDSKLLNACILDVGATGDPAFAQSAVAAGTNSGPTVAGAIEAAGGNKRCNTYSIVAVAQNMANLSSGCGYVGGNWTSDLGAHYRWCAVQQSQSLPDSEIEKRRLALAQCSR